MSPVGKLGFRDVTDGLSNTIMGIESLGEDAVKWTQPDDIRLDKEDPLKMLQDGTRQGFHVVLADGAVVFIANQILVLGFMRNIFLENSQTIGKENALQNGI